jgi:hypothetical protein
MEGIRKDNSITTNPSVSIIHRKAKINRKKKLEYRVKFDIFIRNGSGIRNCPKNRNFIINSSKNRDNFKEFCNI